MSDSRPGLQALLAEVLNDPSLMAGLRSDPDAFAAARGADPLDARRLCELDQAQFDIAALTHFERRQSWVSARFEGTTILLGALNCVELIARCVEETRPPAMTARDFLMVGLHLRSLIDNLDLPDDDASTVREMIEFETLLYELQVRQERQPAPVTAQPELSIGVAVVTFGRPIAEIRRRIVGRLPFGDLPGDPASYIVQAGLGVQARTYPLKSPLRDLLAACDGTATPEEIAERLAQPAEAVDRALRRLRDKGVLTWNAAG